MLSLAALVDPEARPKASRSADEWSIAVYDRVYDRVDEPLPPYAVTATRLMTRETK